jgi:hypothetical protein
MADRLQLHIRVDRTLKDRINVILKRTKAEGFGAFQQFVEGIIEDGVRRKEQTLKRARTK